LNSFFDSSPPLLSPRDIVTALTRSAPEALQLPRRAIITFNDGDVGYVLGRAGGKLVESWSPFKKIFLLDGSETVITRCYIGGPGIAALVEEFSAFGVEEFILWGYCGAIDRSLSIGDIVIARGALREDGVSYHYMERDDAVIYPDWFETWEPLAKDRGFRDILIWSCDAIYRETAAKVARYRETGVGAVEMEAASFYSVCDFKGLKGIVFLVVSDLLTGSVWQGGFRTKPFKEGVRGLARFFLSHVVQ
jgi:uridine phosphorylase